MRWIILCIAATLWCGALWYAPYIRDMHVSALSICAYPIVYVQHWLYSATYAVAASWISHGRLSRELAWYKQLYHHERAARVQAEASLAHIEETQELARFARRYGHGYGIVAQIIFRQCNADQHYILIDAGRAQGVQQDMIAVYNSTLIGRVETVYPYYSCVRSITDCTLPVPVMCLHSHTQGVHYGDNDVASSHIAYVSHLAHPEPGEPVVTRARGIVYPFGFGVGRVHSYILDGLYYRVDVEPYVDMYDIGYCLIIQPGAEHEASASSDGRT